MTKRFDYSIGDIPDLTMEQMVEVDRAMVEDYEICLIQMMENAGRNLAHLARERFLDRNPRGKQVVVMAGRGGNGGGAMVAARRLSNWGASVSVCLSAKAESFSGVAAHQLGILSRMRLVICGSGDLAFLSDSITPNLVVDGLVGYSLSGAPHGPAAEMIRWANGQSGPVLALDVPSGLDTASGETPGVVINAAATLTLALPKKGLRSRRSLVGELYLADIGVPPGLYMQEFGLQVGPLFAESDIVRLE